MRPLVLLVLLSGCGPYQLAEGTAPPAARGDWLECREEARTFAGRPEAQARAFATGFFIPVFGVAVAAEHERKDARWAYRACMEARGYRVTEVRP